MILIDVNVMVYAHRPESPDHDRYRGWLHGVIDREQYGVADIILSSFLRLVTNPRIYKEPTPINDALDFLDHFRSGSGAVQVGVGPKFWNRFAAMCRATRATGNLIPDVFLAALAIEADCAWVTTDRDFGRIPDVRWRHPLA